LGKGFTGQRERFGFVLLHVLTLATAPTASKFGHIWRTIPNLHPKRRRPSARLTTRHSKDIVASKVRTWAVKTAMCQTSYNVLVSYVCVTGDILLHSTTLHCFEGHITEPVKITFTNQVKFNPFYAEYVVTGIYVLIFVNSFVWNLLMHEEYLLLGYDAV
jgi:hypothetical protein